MASQGLVCKEPNIYGEKYVHTRQGELCIEIVATSHDIMAGSLVPLTLQLVLSIQKLQLTLRIELFINIILISCTNLELPGTQKATTMCCARNSNFYVDLGEWRDILITLLVCLELHKIPLPCT